MVRQRRGRAGAGDTPAAPAPELEHHQPDAATVNNSSSTSGAGEPEKDVAMPGTEELRVGGPRPSWSGRTQWIMLAVASGACAAFNGVFAKLTTTGLTSSIASSVASALGLSSAENVVEVVVRGIFFALNLTFNGVMWTLFTAALAKGTSTTQVSIINTSTNFVLTALLGLAIFSEALPPLWWAGAAMLVAGNVIVGRKDESKAQDHQHPGIDGDGDVDVDASAVPAAGARGGGGAVAGTGGGRVCQGACGRGYHRPGRSFE
ncbi:hypothetical protein ACCO45_010926 [Purpureocillium lilacinum]|uniref:Uncharacterized protein n=1 Tax=Purpureocillium lilacinum TaxID=33203 RepID=A0ACC4DGZ2_PURLI